MANAMEYPEASKIGLATIADYLWDPKLRLTPATSWQRAIVEIAGEADAPALSLFADTVRGPAVSPIQTARPPPGAADLRLPDRERPLPGRGNRLSRLCT